MKKKLISNKLESLNRLNNEIHIHSVYDKIFSFFGILCDDFDLSRYISLCHEGRTESGVTYLPGIVALEQLPVTGEIRRYAFGDIPIQVGCGRGFNNTCNALEYHKSIEVIVAITDLLLLLGRVDDIKDDRYDVSQAIHFFVPRHSVVELRPLVLHFAPIQTDDNEFIAVIILPQTTNLSFDNESTKSKKGFLFSRNKWLLAHPDTEQAAMGAFVGLRGNRIVIKT